MRKILAAFVLMSCAAPLVAAQSRAKPLGMILDVQGTVNVRRGLGNERALPADLLFEGDQITTAANGKVTFTFCPPSQRFSLSADSTVSVGAAAVQQSKGAPASKAAAARCTLPQVALGKREIDHIGAMTARGAPAIPLYVGGAISTTRPQFMWGKPVPAVEEYKLTVKTPSGQVLWTLSQTGQVSQVQMPQTIAELRPGTYVWELVGMAGGKKAAEQTAMFEVKPNPELASIRGEGLSQFEMAAAFENARYYSEAAAIYRTLRSQNADDPRFTRNLLWLYWEMGLFAASNDELKKMNAQ